MLAGDDISQPTPASISAWTFIIGGEMVILESKQAKFDKNVDGIWEHKIG